MTNPNRDIAGSGPDILARFVAEQEDTKFAETHSEEVVEARDAFRATPIPGDPGKPDPALASLSTDQLRQRLADQLKAAHPEAYGPGWRPSHEDAERERRLREAK